MPTSSASGTQTATIGTEHTLATVSTEGNYVLYVDTANMALGDELELRVKLKVTSTGTTRQYLIATYSHVQSDPIKGSIPVSSVNEAVFTLKQTAGTGRSFDWEVVSL